jgi:deaminated glutathione amidase
VTTPEDALWLSNTVTVAAGQFGPTGDRRENLRQITMYVQEAADRAAALVVFPEYAACFARRLDDEVVARAEPLDGPFVTGLAELARAHHACTWSPGSPRRRRTSPRACQHARRPLPRRVSLEAVYRKVHLFDTFGHHESKRVAPGRLDPGPDLRGLRHRGGAAGRLRSAVPGAHPRHRLGGRGARAVIPPSGPSGSLKELHWRTLLQARAIESTATCSRRASRSRTASADRWSSTRWA